MPGTNGAVVRKPAEQENRPGKEFVQMAMLEMWGVTLDQAYPLRFVELYLNKQ